MFSPPEHERKLNMTTTNAPEPSTHDEIRDLIDYARYDADWQGKRLLLDAFCCQGAMTSGYQDAGFIVFGVDIDPKALKRYVGNFFVQHDAVEFIRLYGHLFDAISASPPCQDYSLTQRIVSNDFPRLIEPTRNALQHAGVPYVIENVWGAFPDLIDPVMLCGASFGLHTYRHRLFEFGNWDGAPAVKHEFHERPTVKMGRALKDGDFYHAVGNFQQVDYVRKDLNLPWMNRDGLRECAPRQFAQYIGVYLQRELGGRDDEQWHSMPLTLTLQADDLGPPTIDLVTGRKS
jgi:DNA (cytosine-5)-methyltransferase 1